MYTNVPFFEAEDVYGNVGIPEADKKLVFLEKSGHLPMISEPDKLAESILSFIEEH